MQNKAPLRGLIGTTNTIHFLYSFVQFPTVAVAKMKLVLKFFLHREHGASALVTAEPRFFMNHGNLLSSQILPC